MKKLTVYLLTGLLSAASLTHSALADSVRRDTGYRVTPVGALPGKKESAAAALNNLGQIVGTSFSEALTERAFRFNPATGAIEEIGNKPAEALTRAFGLNDAGEVVGDSTFGAVSIRGGGPMRSAAFFRAGSSASLGRLAMQHRYSRATDINNNRLIVGLSSLDPNGDNSRAFAWSERVGIFDLGTLGGDTAQALAINDAGFITGHSEIAANRIAGVQHAFLGRALTNGKVDRLIDLGTLGGSFSYGTAISEKNHVVGYSTLDHTSDRMHAFLYDAGKMHDLGSLTPEYVALDQSFALGVNSAGHVVGYALVPFRRDSPQVAFIYRDGVMRDLNELIGSATERYFIQTAIAINDRGQIAATAFDRTTDASRAVLLTPIESRSVR